LQEYIRRLCSEILTRGLQDCIAGWFLDDEGTENPEHTTPIFREVVQAVQAAQQSDPWRFNFPFYFAEEADIWWQEVEEQGINVWKPVIPDKLKQWVDVFFDASLFPNMEQPIAVLCPFYYPWASPTKGDAAWDKWTQSPRWAEAIQNEIEVQTEGIPEALQDGGTTIKNELLPGISEVQPMSEGDFKILNASTREGGVRIPCRLAPPTLGPSAVLGQFRLGERYDVDIDIVRADSGETVRVIREEYPYPSPPATFPHGRYENGIGQDWEPSGTPLAGTSAFWDGLKTEGEPVDIHVFYGAYLRLNGVRTGQPISLRAVGYA
jgi:hypothetical protein